MELFPFVGPEHPFYSDIARLRTEVSRHPLWRDAMHRTSPTAVRTLMRGRQIPGGEWRLQWVYVSFQFRDESRPLRFDALTLLYSAKTQQIDAYEFPRDPYLPTAASFFADAASGPMGRGSDLDVDVRRYVPRRRLTFLVRRPLEGGAPVVGKFVRNAELETAYETLGEVYRAVISLGEHRKAIGDNDLRRIVERVRTPASAGSSATPHQVEAVGYGHGV